LPEESLFTGKSTPTQSELLSMMWEYPEVFKRLPPKVALSKSKIGPNYDVDTSYNVLPWPKLCLFTSCNIPNLPKAFTD